MPISPANQKEIITNISPQALLALCQRKPFLKTHKSRFSDTSCFVYTCEGANITKINSSLKQVVNM